MAGGLFRGCSARCGSDLPMRSRARRTLRRTRSSVRRAAVEDDHQRRPGADGRGAGRQPARQAARQRGDQVLRRRHAPAGGGAFDDVGDELRQRLAGGIVEGSRSSLPGRRGPAPRHRRRRRAHLLPAGVAHKLLANLGQVSGRNHDNDINVTCWPCFAKSKCEDQGSAPSTRLSEVSAGADAG